MHDQSSHLSDTATFPALDLELDTARWTSSVYQVQFSQLSQITPQQMDMDAFRLSAWGMSVGLKHLLQDYSDFDIKAALDWLVIQQNAHVVHMLGDAISSHGFNMDMLDQVFISLDTELFLPHGLRMHVTCITNIVQVGENVDALDKFVAILDPGEAQTYVAERRGLTVSKPSSVIH